MSNIDENKPTSEQQDPALLKRVAKKQFYFAALALLAIFLLFIVPNYNDGENLYAIITVGISFLVLLGVYAKQIFSKLNEKTNTK
ncbi:MAG: hypothetical protein HRU25_03915 [Psychrobium sp.]|nr:hypothetical protein [Psychrobium sp.]